jgi:CitB family two-component system sensor histidine kinase MalK
LITIIGNLIDNAMEAVEQTPEKRIKLWIDCLDGILRLEVTDTGTGIPAEAVKRIFAKGYSTKADNRGLGLFLVQRSVEKLRGKIELCSEPGQGARFRVELPYQVR